ncbi:metallophosphoesterase family protein [Acinetobacter rathckeae]|uniref:metallophosphoesterase family protein n=1 Tax=Acinetobacter rathckeae TaxID=2605272 RepID=UPI0018A2E013|nr:metallophosphoesterase [Acinetobacter rathckeae]MBF7687035.1 metallophosphoesterase [Acinetobacter rathckeae]MBF7694561.1 metallophosphoesterase [Acinetobacter rathckeae]
MLLHLSDLHFGTEKKSCLDAIRLFCKQSSELEAVVVSGDLTQRAKFAEFLACKQFLKSLHLPYLVVPGNHDIPLYHVWKRVFYPFTFYEGFFGPAEQVLETKNFYLMGLNSIRRRHHTKGDISFAQIEQMNHKLKKAPANKLKLVVVHQPFYTPRKSHGWKDCPKQAKLALERWGGLGLFGLLHGHLHHTGVYNLTQLFDLNVTQPIWDIHAGTATSWRLRKNQPNSFNTISATGEVKHYSFHELKGVYLETGL